MPEPWRCEANDKSQDICQRDDDDDDSGDDDGDDDDDDGDGGDDDDNDDNDDDIADEGMIMKMTIVISDI